MRICRASLTAFKRTLGHSYPLGPALQLPLFPPEQTPSRHNTNETPGRNCMTPEHIPVVCLGFIGTERDKKEA